MVVAVALSTPTQAVTVYVDAVYGNDVWSGRLAAPSGSPSTDGPWQSLTKVSSQTFQPGDVILLKCGQTWNETLKVASNGTAANPISVGSYPNGCAAKPLIDGAIPIPSRSWTARPGNIYLALLPVDLLVNTALSDGASGWGVSAPNRDATLITTNDCGSGGSPPCLTAIGGTVGNTIIYSLFEHRVSLSPSSTYTLRFRAKAAVGVNARVMVRRAGPPWDIVGLNQPVIGTGSWATYSFEFSAATSLQNARVDIELPGGRPAISVDDVRLTLRNDLLLGLFAEGTKLVQAHHPNVGHNQNSANSVYLHTASDSLAGAGGGSSYLTMGSDVATQVQSAITPGQTIRIRSRPWVIDERLVTSVAGGVINFDQPT